MIFFLSRCCLQMEYFESENAEAELQAKNMFQIWLENDTDPTPENLLYTLEGLQLLDVAKDIFWTIWVLFFTATKTMKYKKEKKKKSIR